MEAQTALLELISTIFRPCWDLTQQHGEHNQEKLSALLSCCPALQGNSKLCCCSPANDSTAVDTGDGFAWSAAVYFELAKEDLHSSIAVLVI